MKCKIRSNNSSSAFKSGGILLLVLNEKEPVIPKIYHSYNPIESYSTIPSLMLKFSKIGEKTDTLGSKVRVTNLNERQHKKKTRYTFDHKNVSQTLYLKYLNLKNTFSFHTSLWTPRTGFPIVSPRVAFHSSFIGMGIPLKIEIHGWNSTSNELETFRHRNQIPLIFLN